MRAGRHRVVQENLLHGLVQRLGAGDLLDGDQRVLDVGERHVEQAAGEVGVAADEGGSELLGAVGQLAGGRMDLLGAVLGRGSCTGDEVTGGGRNLDLGGHVLEGVANLLEIAGLGGLGLGIRLGGHFSLHPHYGSHGLPRSLKDPGMAGI